jgi:hypothetical protein
MSMIICLLRPLNHDVMAGLAATALLMIHLVPLPFAPHSAGSRVLMAAGLAQRRVAAATASSSGSRIVPAVAAGSVAAVRCCCRQVVAPVSGCVRSRHHSHVVGRGGMLLSLWLRICGSSCSHKQYTRTQPEHMMPMLPRAGCAVAHATLLLQPQQSHRATPTSRRSCRR